MNKTEHHFPKEFLESMAHQLGDELPAFLESLNQSAPVSIRYNRAKTSEGAAQQIPWCASAYYLDARPSFTRDPLFHAGAYYVQEASSMFLEQAVLQSVSVQTPITALDLCAAPGGKSTHLVSLLHEESFIISNEVIKTRASILAENIQKWGYSNVVVTNNDPEDFARLEGLFDLIVVDAPCSGEGMFRKDETAINEWSTDNVALCSKRQQRILADVWPALKANGILIYCTCTFNTSENEENLRWLQENFHVESLPIAFPADWGIETIPADTFTGYRFYPHKTKGEGFFISVIRKKETTPTVSLRSKNKLTVPAAQIQEQLRTWVKQPERFSFVQWHERVVMFHTQHLPFIEFLSGKLGIVSSGTIIAEVKHTKLIPDHALAMCIHLNPEAFTLLDVSEEQALIYLKKETFTPDTTQTGFALVRFQTIPLGFVNLLGNRLNNLYPKNLRIRMAV